MRKMQSRRFRTWWISLGVILIALAAVGAISVETYNSLAKQNQEVEAQWSQVENVMQHF
jgi:LemA protein